MFLALESAQSIHCVFLVKVGAIPKVKEKKRKRKRKKRRTRDEEEAVNGLWR
jgi:hypothetical protein